MVAAARRPARMWLWLGLSLVSGGMSIFTLEFFLGLEILRPLFLWIALRQDLPTLRRRLRRMLLLWAPFLALLAAYLYWRVSVVRFIAYQPRLVDGLIQDPAGTILRLFTTILGDLYQAGILAWARAFTAPDVAEFGARSTIILGVLVVGAFGVMAAYLARLDGDRTGATSLRGDWWRDACAMGVLALLMGGWPYWIADLPLELYFPWDRFTLGLMFGASILPIGFIEGVFRCRGLKVVLVSLIVAFAIGQHFQVANSYRRAWQAQQRFFWNLTCRLPGLEPGTAILANELPLAYVTDNSLTGPIIWMYDPEYSSGDMPYVLLDIDKRLGGSLPALEDDRPIRQWYSATTFHGSTSQVLVLSFRIPGCVRVVDPVLDDSSVAIDRAAGAAAHLSDLDLVRTEVARPGQLPAHLQGPEPPRSWCFFFEQADLARQLGDWERVVRLGDEAFASGQHPEQAEERVPFIEGYAHLARWTSAQELTADALVHNPGSDRILCHAWRRIDAQVQADEEGAAVIRAMKARVCGMP
jgi:hypothetical protein